MTFVGLEGYFNETDQNRTFSDIESTLTALQELLAVLKKLQKVEQFRNVYVIVVPVIFSVITVIGVIGNCLVLLVAYQNRRY